jgi:glycosyltransferase involved in cell wall biosynthesis
LINGVAPEKVSVSRHGVAQQDEFCCNTPANDRSETTRFAFVGRFDPTKGLHVIIDAFRELSSSAISLDVFGIAQSASNAAYACEMQDAAKNDRRIKFNPPLKREAVIERLREYDFLLVPSQWMETGPLVVLEAFAAGTPVIGYRVGGIAELVRDNVDGLLVDAEPSSLWGATLHKVAEDRQLRLRLKAGVQSPRTTANVADEMASLYRSLPLRTEIDAVVSRARSTGGDETRAEL